MQIKTNTVKNDWFEMVLIRYNEKYVVWTSTQLKMIINL